MHTKLWRHHQLVALQWIPNPNNYPIIDHMDGNRTNNVVSNLHWCTRKMNQQNFTQKHGVKYDMVSELPEDNFQITNYGNWMFENYYYSIETDAFYYWTGVSYRVLRILYNRSGGAIVHMRDTTNAHRSIMIAKFKREYDLD
jgi:hypothetical protein